MMPASAARGPSALLPLAYLVVATLAFLTAAVATPMLAPELAGHYYHPRVLALTHTVTLGWITLTIMGASYQIVPIVLGCAVWSERLARWQLGFMTAGVAGMVGHFFIGQWNGLVWAAGLVALGVAAHLLNVALTVRSLGRWTFTARLVALGHVGLALTTVAGLVLGLDKLLHVLPGSLFDNLHAHVQLALLGWVLPMVIGVAARVYPMFLLAREPQGWPGRVQLWGLTLGVPATVVGIVESRALLAAGALAVAAAVAAHLGWIVAMVRDRKRPALDWGLRFALTGAVALVPAAALGLAMAFDLAGGPRVALTYAALALGAWASLTIAGMLLKIVPFLVWYRAYSGRVGRERVPMLADLSWPAAEGVAWALLTAGFAGLTVALLAGDPAWIRAAGITLAAGALVLGATLAHVVHHLMPCGRAVAPVETAHLGRT
ncbi:MAG TPA: hypothetical protein VFL90_00975 [Methylomirabilota bacterium]|nr:hypothetical protein [Methylomirabilota bacterium]